MTRRAAVAAVVVSAAAFATQGVLLRMAYAHGAEPYTLLAARFAIAAWLMTAVQAIRDRRALRVSRSDLGSFLALSLTGYGAASLCYAFAVREVGAAVTTVLLFTYPAIVCVIGWLWLGEPFSVRRAIAVLMTFAGCALVSDVLSHGRVASVPGLLLGLGAGLSYAVYSVLSQRTLARASRPTITAYMFGFSALFMAAIAAANRTLGTLAHWQPAAWGALALIVAVPTFAAVTLYLGGIRGMGAPQAAVVSTLELPFTVAIAAAAFADERLSAVQLAGAAIVLAGVVLAEWGSPPGEVEPAAV